MTSFDLIWRLILLLLFEKNLDNSNDQKSDD